jgi:hypothetical protein
MSTTPKRDARRARAAAAAFRELARAETRLHRAFTRWSDARATVRRYEREADREAMSRPSTGLDFDDELPATSPAKE